MNEHVIIEVHGTLEEDVIKELKEHNLHVASEKYLLGAEIISVVLIPTITIITEKFIVGIVDTIGKSKDRFTIKYKGKAYKNLSGEGAKKIITSIMKGHLPE